MRRIDLSQLVGRNPSSIIHNTSDATLQLFRWLTFWTKCQNLVLSYDFALVGYRNMVPSHLLEQLTKFLWDTNTGPGES